MTLDQPNFEYDNLTNRPTGKFIRVSSKLLPGVRKVQAQIARYAEAWSTANNLALQQTGPLWVVLGDSMAQGVGASAYDKGWAGQLQAMLQKAGKEYRVINLSMSGARVADVLERQLPALRSLGIEPALVTVLIGSNDMVNKTYRRDLLTNYHELLKQLPAHTFLISPFGNFGVGETVNQLIRHDAPEYGITVVENKLSAGLSSWKGKLSEDHFHPNDDGYKEFALLFYEALLQSATK